MLHVPEGVVVVEAVSNHELVRDGETNEVGLEATGTGGALLEKRGHFEASGVVGGEEGNEVTERERGAGGGEGGLKGGLRGGRERGERGSILLLSLGSRSSTCPSIHPSSPHGSSSVNNVLHQKHVFALEFLQVAARYLDSPRALRPRVALCPDEVEGEGDVFLLGELVEVAETDLEVLEEGGTAFEDAEEVDGLTSVGSADVGCELLDPVHYHAVGDEDSGDTILVVVGDEEVILGLLLGRRDGYGLKSGGATEGAGTSGS